MREQLAAATKNSSTSSKPPSSDIVKPKTKHDDPNQFKRSIGGQPGHPMHTREPFTPDQVTFSQTPTLDACPCCGGELHRNGTLARVVQQVDIQQTPLTIQEHVCPDYWCGKCQKSFKAELPLPIQKGGLVGAELTTLIAFMKGVCHASFSTVRKFFRDVVGGDDFPWRVGEYHQQSE